jgi:hypothetical protein
MTGKITHHLVSLGSMVRESIQRVTAGNTYDEYEVDLFNTHVELWRRKTLEGLPFVHPEKHESSWAMNPPSSISVILYLRANQLRGLVLCPFFWPTSPLSAAREEVMSALELVWDTIYMLYIMNESTDFYRKQHLFFHHFLASAVALLFLVISHEVESQPSPASFTPDQPATVYVNQASMYALSLTATYRGSSRASEELWKRLNLMFRLFSMRGFPLPSEPGVKEPSPMPTSLLNPKGHDIAATQFENVFNSFSRVHTSEQADIPKGGPPLSPFDNEAHLAPLVLQQSPHLTLHNTLQSSFNHPLGVPNEIDPFFCDGFLNEETDRFHG